jgi:hypothetical protein
MGTYDIQACELHLAKSRLREQLGVQRLPKIVKYSSRVLDKHKEYFKFVEAK